MQQKLIAEKCSRVGIPFIISTQMLETMTLNPVPSSAEVADVTNAILDGADCICLSGETGTGRFPLAAVTTCDRIISEAEQLKLRTKNLSTLDVYRRDRN
jgi:pyruvate kinase